MKYTVVCFNQRLTHYREAFFQRCRDYLSSRNVEFEFVHGKPDADALTKNDQGFLSWSFEVEPRIFQIFGVQMVWIPLPNKISKPDLLILPQENKLVANYFWLICRFFGGPKIAFWGHGRNFQTSDPNGLREKWKLLLIGLVDWWFGYTQLTRNILLSDGYPDGRISVLDNAIDNEVFQHDLMAVDDEDLRILRGTFAPNVDLGGAFVLGLFCGSLYPDKKIDFLIAAADRIKEKVPGFVLVVIGDGPSSGEVKDAAHSRPWLLAVGAKKGRDKAQWFKLASVVLNPGLVGLHIVDSFCAGVPMITTANARHSPEIAYLESGINGLIVSGGVEDYADAVVKILNDSLLLGAMKEGALKSASRYTLDNMVRNFCEGIERCLSLPKK